MVKIAASEIRFWSKTIGKRLPRAKIVLLEEPIYAMGYTRRNRDGLLRGVSRHIPPRVFFLCKFILSFHCENQLTEIWHSGYFVSTIFAPVNASYLHCLRFGWGELYSK